MKNTITIITALLFAALIVYAADVVVYPTTTGYPYKCPIPKTGQTNSYVAEDDGALEKGIAWPNPRFTVQANTNCVLDNLTGLMWARNANQFGKVDWGTSITNCNSLDYGGYTDWRLPNIKELYSLIAWQYCNPALSDGTGTNKWTTVLGPFADVQSGTYWSSTTDVSNTGNAWYMRLNTGYVSSTAKATVFFVFPVRGGR